MTFLGPQMMLESLSIDPEEISSPNQNVNSFILYLKNFLDNQRSL